MQNGGIGMIENQQKDINKMFLTFFIKIFLGVIITSIFIWISFYVNISSKKSAASVTPVCESVDGNNHIYRGQCLSKSYHATILPLSRRASWLTTAPSLDIKAKILVEQMIDEAEKDGMCLVVTSGYRSYEEQEKLYNEAENKSIVAKAGESEHQTGLAVDFAACPMKNGVRNDNVERPELEKDFSQLPEYLWLKLKAYRYGFEQSFTEDNITKTQYMVEPWHWKLVLN